MIVTDFSNLGRVLWDLTLNIVNAMALAYDFLLTPFVIEEISFFGFVVSAGFTFTPLLISSGVIITILGLALFSALWPF